MTVPARQADEALDRLDEALATYHEMRGGETYADQRAEQREALATVRDELGRLRGEVVEWRTSIATEKLTWRAEAAEERARRLEDGLRFRPLAISQLDWIIGYATTAPDEKWRSRLVGKLTDLRALLAGADEPDGGGAK